MLRKLTRIANSFSPRLDSAKKKQEWGQVFPFDFFSNIRGIALTRQMHTDGKKRRSFVTLIFATGDLRR